MNQKTNLFYRRSGSGPAIVLLHGFPDNGEIWNTIAATLATEFTLIVPDLPGSGHSPLNGPTMLSDMARQVKAILDKEGISKTVIAGHSMGGYTAIAFAAQFPQILAGVSLVHSLSSPDDEEKKKNRQKVIELIQKGGKDAFVRQMTPGLFAPSFVKNNPETVQAKAEKGMQMSDAGMINFYTAIMERQDNRQTVQNATYPIQWIAGKEDSLIDFKKILRESHLSGINFVSLYTNVGHMSLIEQPDRLIADLKQFTKYCYSRNPSTE